MLKIKDKEPKSNKVPELPQPSDSTIIDASGAPMDDKDESPIKPWIGFDKIEGVIYGGK